MASLYAAYLGEKTHDCIVETDRGFVTYRFLNNNKTVYVIDIYIIPEVRQKGYASSLADQVAEVAKKKGASEMIGTVIPSNKESTASLKVLLAYGMTVQSASPDLVVFRKDI